MYTSLDHLSIEELAKLKKQYYEGRSVYQLLAEHAIHIAPARFYTLFPPEKVNEYGCATCGVHLVVDAPPRTRLEQRADPKHFYCPVCGNKPFVKNRGWITFPLLSNEEIAVKRGQIHAFYSKQTPPSDYSTLSVTTKIYLASLCLAHFDRKQGIILPARTSAAKLASTEALQQTIYEALLRQGLISVSPESPLDAFDPDSKHFPKQFDIEKAAYTLNLTPSVDPVADFDCHILHNSHEPVKEELISLWKEIAIGECITYLQYRFDKIGFPFSAGKKTHSVFMELLENFSVSQIYYIIWCKVNDVSRWYLEENVTKQHAANSVIGACQRYGEHALMHNKELPQYSRPAQCPRSALTQFFYDYVLNLGPAADHIYPSSQALSLFDFPADKTTD